ncbi:SRPBCC family protein [Erythrobacter sp. HA6-11]
MGDYGKLTAPGTLEFRRQFDADIETVWQFLVDPEKRKLWFCGGSTDDHVGGRIVMEFDHRRLAESAPPEKYADEVIATHDAEILAYDPPHALAFTWFEAAGDGSSRVDITLSETGDGATELLLVHTGLEGHDVIISVFAGWHGHFDLMVETLAGPRKTDFWLRDQQLEAEYAERI